ncbi:MAG: hypothetical protein R3E08_00910 [Thiotrichaceae bacterium]
MPMIATMPDIFLRDRWFNQTQRISVNNVGVEGNGDSTAPVISANGRFIIVQFQSD